jgi:nicotinate-nucleotide adenylyltransferase
VGVFGGTFNPVHYGHLRSALELVEQLSLEQLRLMPCAVPPHREAPLCSAEHRAAMVELAVREGPSYTLDSLLELRAELGAERSLCLVMGCDALLNVRSWHRWQELLEYAHIVVLARPGWQLPGEGEVANWLATNRLDDRRLLAQRAAGGIVLEELRPLDISSTEIRKYLKEGRSARYLLPEPVLEYIRQHKLYQ